MPPIQHHLSPLKQWHIEIKAGGWVSFCTQCRAPLCLCRCVCVCVCVCYSGEVYDHQIHHNGKCEASQKFQMQTM